MNGYSGAGLKAYRVVHGRYLEVPEPIVILSAGRSGSSLVAGILDAAGVWFGDCRGGDKWNPGGYFENRAIFRAMYRIFGRDWLRNPPLDHGEWMCVVSDILEKQSYPSGLWGVKHGAFYAGVWNHYDPLFIFVRRPEGKILESFVRCGFLNNFKAEEVQRIVSLQNELMDDLQDTTGGFRIDADRLVDGDTSQMEELGEFIGLQLFFDAVDKDLWH